MIRSINDNASVNFTPYFSKQLWKTNTNIAVPCGRFTYHFLRTPIVLFFVWFGFFISCATAHAYLVLQRNGKSRIDGVITSVLSHPFCHNRCDIFTDVWKKCRRKTMINHGTYEPFTKARDAIAKMRIPSGNYDMTLNSLNSKRYNCNFQ